MQVNVERLSASVPLKGRHQWDALYDLWNAQDADNRFGISLCKPFRPTAVDVIERIGDTTVFWYQRDVYGPGRKTSIDRYGLVGLSAINLADRRCILTEGVSDFLSLKMCYPETNVLGFTTLGGNRAAMTILLALMDKILYVADNDMGKDDNTGLRGALRIKNTLERYGKRVSVVIPDAPAKDITQQILKECQRFTR